MANCDWGRPCDCSDCRERIDTHACPSCGFLNRVSVMQSSRWVNDMKHGGGYYEFDAPTSPIKDLNCYSCGHHMAAVGYYTSVHERFCEQEKERAALIRAGKVCGSCNKIEGVWEIRGQIKLQEFGGRQLCQACAVDAAKQDNPNPSDKTNKYIFDEEKLEWVLDRVKIPCTMCEKSHWVNVTERSWRKQCKACYSRR